MSLARLYSRAVSGLNAPEVIVEVHVANGLPAFSIVGLPDTEVKESRDRVRSAIQMSGFDFPARRITVNLAPADLPKDSGRYDLPIALGVLIASGLIKPKCDLNQFEFAGELALDGALRKIHGALAIAYSAQKSSRAFVLPKPSATEASLVERVKILAAQTLNEVVLYLSGEGDLLTPDINNLDSVSINHEVTEGVTSLGGASILDFSQVKGQQAAKKALEVAASGRHSLLLLGNPGCGKSMLAKRILSILPPLSTDEAIENASLYSLVYGEVDFSTWKQVPFRQPHHSSSSVAIIGGGSTPRPGEISLAHKGVMFMDELPEFDRRVLEVLREPLENKKVSIARSKQKVDYPADFQLVAAMNPCPCGNHGNPYKVCKCSPEQVNRYTAKVSAPILDRIDLLVQVPQLTPTELEHMPQGESSLDIKNRVLNARKTQFKRQGKLNSELEQQEIVKYCNLDVQSQQLMNNLVNKLGLSARSYYRLLKVSRTIADLNEDKNITAIHIAQAAPYKVSF